MSCCLDSLEIGRAMYSYVLYLYQVTEEARALCTGLEYSAQSLVTVRRTD